MKRLIIATFVVLAGAFYILSGGPNFEPQVRAIPAPEVATAPIADTPLADTAPVVTTEIATPTAPEPTPVAAVEPEPEPTPEPVAAPDTAAQIDALLTEVVAPIETAPSVEPAPPPPADIRSVTAERVNLREGPSTDFDVITSLPFGTEVAITVTDGEWVKISVQADGTEGWMAARFLTPPSTE